MKENELFIKRMDELAMSAYYKNIAVFSGFLNLDELHMLNSRKNSQYGECTVMTFGGYELAERQMAAFIPDALSYEWNYPITCLFIEKKSLKYSEELTHRDYLGALISLGIERSVLGDILVQDSGSYLFCADHISDFITKELCQIKHTAVLTTVIQDPAKLPKPKYELISGTVASLRLDSLSGEAFKTSRSSMIPFIESGKVFVNGKMVVSNGYQVKEGDIISVRHKGKFKFLESSAITKKGRVRVQIQKYI